MEPLKYCSEPGVESRISFATFCEALASIATDVSCSGAGAIGDLD